MSVHVLSWVLRESPVDVPAHRLVLIALAERANDDGTGAYPSIDTLAHETRQSKRNVQYALRSLERDKRIRNCGRSELLTIRWQVRMDARAEAVPYVNSTPGSKQPRGANFASPLEAAPENDGGANFAPQGVQTSAPEPSLRTVHTFYRPDEGGSKDGSGATGLTPPLDGVAPGELLPVDPFDPPSPELTDAWAAVRDLLRAQVDDHKWSMWLEPLVLAGGKRRLVVLAAPTHTRTWVRDRYSVRIREALAAVLGHEPGLDIIDIAEIPDARTDVA